MVVEKSGYEEERGLQPAPGFSWFTKWKYLSRTVRQEIDRAPVQKRRWRYIVVVAAHLVNLAWNGLRGLEHKPKLSS